MAQHPHPMGSSDGAARRASLGVVVRFCGLRLAQVRGGGTPGTARGQCANAVFELELRDARERDDFWHYLAWACAMWALEQADDRALDAFGDSAPAFALGRAMLAEVLRGRARVRP